jgi:hypothetical protein
VDSNISEVYSISVFYVNSEDVGSIKGTSDKQSTVAVCFHSFKLQLAVVNSFYT